MIRRGMPYVGSCGALDMVNFGAPDTVPEKYKGPDISTNIIRKSP